MKTIRATVLCLVVLLLAAPIIRAQDFSKYRDFSLGTNLVAVLKHTDQRLLDVKATHDGSLLFQELTWRRANGIGVSYRSESVDELVFSFYKGELYKIERENKLIHALGPVGNSDAVRRMPGQLLK